MASADRGSGVLIESRSLTRAAIVIPTYTIRAIIPPTSKVAVLFDICSSAGILGYLLYTWKCSPAQAVIWDAAGFGRWRFSFNLQVLIQFSARPGSLCYGYHRLQLVEVQLQPGGGSHYRLPVLPASLTAIPDRRLGTSALFELSTLLRISWPIFSRRYWMKLSNSRCICFILSIILRTISTPARFTPRSRVRFRISSSRSMSSSV